MKERRREKPFLHYRQEGWRIKEGGDGQKEVHISEVSSGLGCSEHGLERLNVYKGLQWELESGRTDPKRDFHYQILPKREEVLPELKESAGSCSHDSRTQSHHCGGWNRQRLLIMRNISKREMNGRARWSLSKGAGSQSWLERHKHLL